VTLQAEDCLALRSASDAQPSPDGERIVYVLNEVDRAADQNLTSIWLVAVADGASRQILASGSQPRWSPDGKWLAFMREDQLWLLSFEGGEPRQVTSVPGGVTGPPVWSPDGRRIAFTARIPSATSSGPRVIRRLRYLLNGAGYIGDGFWHIFTVSVDGAETVQLTSGEWHHFAPAWSPDSAQITCVTTRREDWDTEWVWDVYVLDASDRGGAARCLTDSGGTCAAPAWSPDGQWIAYYANECPGTAYTQDYYLWLVPAAGGIARNVSRALLDRGCQVSQPPSRNEPPHWAQDSSTVFCHIREAGFFHYYAYDLAGSSLRRIVSTCEASEPIDGWVRQSADGTLLAFAAATAVRPAEIYVCEQDGAHRRQLTNLNDVIEVGGPERLTHQSPEGWEVESWLWLPPAYRTGDAPLPTVLYFHGGPHNTVGLAFNETMHVLAGAGFAIVAVNFRGSTGFGAAFADSILRDWGTRELADGVSIVDSLVEQGIVDRRRLGVYGGSYGGFMTNLALSRTDRFAAGVSFATISALDSWGYQTDHWESVDWDSGGPPWQIPEYYRSHSPLTYVADIHAPLLILHGEEDYRCSVAEADQLFGALRKLKRTVELVRYPGGAHAFAHTGPPSYRLDAMQRVLAWFQRYL
jgi:dipeptidyl aminopeptidase/acylaminoacyl peptidase